MKNLISIAGVLLCLSASTGTPKIFAQEADLEQDTIADVIIVTADGRARDQRDIGAAIALIDGSDVEATHTIRVSDVLARAPGTFLSGLNGPREIVQIRQPLAFDNRTLFLEDGVPLQSSIFFDQSALTYSSALSAPASIEVLRGPGTALYGSDAFSGIVHVVSNPAPDDTQVHLRARFGTFGLYDTLASIGGRLSDRQSTRITVSASGEEGFRDETAFDRLQILGRHSFQSEKFEIDSALNYTDYETESATAISFSDFLAGSRESGLSSLVDPDAARELGEYFKAQSKISYTANETLQLVVTPYYRRQDIQSTATFQPATVPRTTAIVDTLGILQKLYFTPNKNIQTIIGFDIEQTDFSRLTDQTAPDTVVFGSLFLQGVQFDYDVDYLGLSPYIQYEQQIGVLNITLGLRYDNVRYDFDNALTEIPGDARLQLEDRRDRFDALSPKASVVWTLNDSHSLFSRYARGFRIPRESDLYELEEGQTGFSLTPETIDSGEIGWRFQNSKLQLELLGYWAVTQDGIITDIQTAAGNISVNGGSSRFRGIEASASAQLPFGFSASGNFAFQDFRFRRRQADGPDPFDGNLISEAPRTLGFVEFAWQPQSLNTVDLRARLRHIGRWALNDSNTTFTDNEFILAFSGNWRVTDWLSINLQLDNVTDALYPVFADAPVFAPNGRARPGAPRTFSGGIDVRF